MKIPICPNCNKKIARTIEVIHHGVTIFYLNGYHYGPIWFRDYSWGKMPHKQKGFVAYCCRRCDKQFPDSMTKEITKYLVQDKILSKLKN